MKLRENLGWRGIQRRYSEKNLSMLAHQELPNPTPSQKDEEAETMALTTGVRERQEKATQRLRIRLPKVEERQRTAVQHVTKLRRKMQWPIGSWSRWIKGCRRSTARMKSHQTPQPGPSCSGVAQQPLQKGGKNLPILAH